MGLWVFLDKISMGSVSLLPYSGSRHHHLIFKGYHRKKCGNKEFDSFISSLFELRHPNISFWFSDWELFFAPLVFRASEHWLRYIIGLLSWRWQIVGLLNLYNHISQFFIINKELWLLILWRKVRTLSTCQEKFWRC